MPKVLPDSRLKNSKIGDVIADWPIWKLGDNGLLTKHTIRMALQPIYCISCPRLEGYVPRDIIASVTFLCWTCSEKYGTPEEMANWWSSDQAFWAKVAEEMMSTYGHVLTERELFELGEQGRLSQGLRLLERESPYRNQELRI